MDKGLGKPNTFADLLIVTQLLEFIQKFEMEHDVQDYKNLGFNGLSVPEIWSFEVGVDGALSPGKRWQQREF